MADNDRLPTLNSVSLSGTTKSWAEKLNDNFAELDERKTDIGNTATLVHDADYVHTDNNYTTAEKNKLAGVNAGAQVNVLEGVQVNGTDLPISGKKVNIPYDLSSFITNTVDTLVNYYKKSETYTKTEVNTLIGNIKTIQIQVVQTLPATGQSNIIYLVPKTGSTTGSYTEYIWVADTSSFEEIGDTDVDLSNYPTIDQMNTAIANALAAYYTKTQVDTLLANKADNVLASAGGGMAAFAVGDTISSGDKIHFDTTKGSELLTYLQNNAGVNLIEVDNTLLLGSGEEGGIYLLYFVINNMPTYIYSSQAVPEYEITLGFQNLDSNGDFTLSLNSSVSITKINDTTPATWNGIIIGKSGGSGAGVDGLMSSADKGKLDGISAGANKVEASNTNGNIKIDGQEVQVYRLPTIDQVSEYSFTASDAGWGALADGIYTLTISNTAGKRPFVCYNGDGEQVMATIGYTASTITVKTDTKFDGKVLAI